MQTLILLRGFRPIYQIMDLIQVLLMGEMGSYTKEAIKAFQRKVGLIPDGVAGARTKSEMKKYTGC
jgi:peptidoglycan hydrolase-like protein with peptidoglycan-binding domain